jgi:hypothetical protein
VTLPPFAGHGVRETGARSLSVLAVVCRACWRLSGGVAVLLCCIVCRISGLGLSRPDRFGLDQRPWPVLLGRHCTAVNCNPAMSVKMPERKTPGLYGP